MPQEEPKKEENVNEENSLSKEFLSKVEDMKANYVEKSKYENLEKEYRILAEDVLNGNVNKNNDGENVDTDARIKEIRETLFNPEKVQSLTNLDGYSMAVELRDLLIEKGEGDIFLPNQERSVEHGAVITPEDRASAEHFATTIKEMVKEADGDPNYFNSLLNKAIR